MSTFQWDDELTELAIKNQTHQSWAVVNPADMLNALSIIAEKAEGYPVASKEELREAIGTKEGDFLDRLKDFGFIEESPEGQETPVYLISKKPRSPGFHAGGFLVDLIRSQGINSPDALTVIGHNFILGARQSLEFCAALQRPGLTKDALEKRFLNHLVFNNKLNEFKFDNLLKFLGRLGVVEEVEKLFKVDFSPAPLTFYCMAERYLLDADYVIDTRVNAADQECYLDRLLPAGNKRDMRFESLGLSQFPFEGWGKYDTWLTGSGFRELLRIGLIHPLSVAKVLAKMVADSGCESLVAADQALARIREKFVKDTVGDADAKPVWKSPLEGLSAWRRVLGISEVAHRQEAPASDV